MINVTSNNNERSIGKMDYIAHIRPNDQKEQSVTEHVLTVAELCREWGKNLGLGAFAELLGRLHDLGKTTVDFTEYIRYSSEHPEDKSRRGTIDHATAGAQYLYDTYYSGDAYDKLLVEIASMILCSHHGGLMNYLDMDCKSEFLTRIGKDKGETRYWEATVNYFRECCPEGELKDLFFRAKKELCSIFNLKTETGKIKTFFDFSMLTKLLFSYLIDADRLDTYLFMEDKEEAGMQTNAVWARLLEKMEAHLDKIAEDNKDDKIGRLRSKISAECKAFAEKKTGIYSLTVPTGGGKTFSSFRYALAHAQQHHKERIIYIIPFQSIIDQNAADIKDIFHEDHLFVEHHSNIVVDNEDEDYKLLTERYNSPVIFTTMVQFLNTLFKGGTQSVRRMHHLSNAVIIFDEVQSVPIKCISLFNLSLNFLSRVCNSTILLCTATQPALSEVERPILKSAESEMVSDLSEVFRSFRRVEVVPKLMAGGYTYDELADMVFEELDEMGRLKKKGEMKRNPSALIILNTKKNAGRLYDVIKNRSRTQQNSEASQNLENSQEPPKYQVFHLSTKMCPAHRMRILEEIKSSLKNKERVICVSTQLIEAGVNISFGCVFRALAGLDSIAQAAGRGNRHGEEKRAKVYIVNPEDENLSMLPEIKAGQNATDQVLCEFEKDAERFDNDLLSPAAISRYFQCYYATIENQMDFPVKLENGMKTEIVSLLNQNKTAATSYHRKHGKAAGTLLKQAYRLAGDKFYVIEENAKGVLVPYKEGKNIITALNGSNLSLSELNRLLHRAQRFSVNLFRNEFDEISKKGGFYTLNNGDILALKDEFYNDETGWQLEAQRMEFLNVQ